jgi:hypothetical protein
MFLPYAVEDNIERKKTELNVVLKWNLVLLYKIYIVSKKCVLRVSIPTGFFLRTLLCIEILPHKQG